MSGKIRRQPTGFDSPPRVFKPMSQDYFLMNNNFLMDEKVDAPRGGACSGHDTSMWFPFPKGGFDAAENEKKQKAIEICRTCPIRAKCLVYSLEYEPHGIWGGFTEVQRGILAAFWKITPKRSWVSRGSLNKYRQVVDYITYPEDIEFVQKVAHEENLAQPFAAQRSSVQTAPRRRIRKGLAVRTR